jgi:hypothetical protein
LIVDAPMNRHLSIGIEADHMQIRTTGSHHWVETGNSNVDETWDNGVRADSDQTSMTAYLRYNW